MTRLETYWSVVARLIWPALLGFAACAALVVWRGPQLLWIVAAIVAAAAIVISIIARQGRHASGGTSADLGDKAARS